MTSEELTDKLLNVRDSLMKEIHGISIGEAVELMAIFNACVCEDIAEAAKGTATKEDIFEEICNLASKSLKIRDKANDY